MIRLERRDYPTISSKGRILEETVVVAGVINRSRYQDSSASIIVQPWLQTRILRLTLLAPTIIEAILEGRQPQTLELDGLLERFPIEWDKQRETLTES